MTLSFAQMRLAEWTTAVRTHVAGTIDGPLKTVASWPREHVTLVVRLTVERLLRLLVVRDDGVATREHEELAGTLLRALSLHTDIAIVERDAKAASGMPAAVILVDGRETRFIRRSAHWEIARQIAAGLGTRPVEAPRIAAMRDQLLAGGVDGNQSGGRMWGGAPGPEAPAQPRDTGR